MTAPNLRSIDLNLLPILRQLLIERSVTEAARSLSLAQPTISKALARLRKALDDPLLVRSGQKMILTPRGERLLPEVDAQCLQLQRLWANEAFDPATSQRRFVIACTDYEALALLPELASQLSEKAPLVALSFSEISAATGDGAMADIDLVIAPAFVLQPILGPEILTTELFEERFVSIRPASQTAGQPGTDRPPGGRRPLAYKPAKVPEDIRRDFGEPLARDPFATLPNFTVIPLLSLLTGRPAIVPRMVAERFAAYLPLSIVEEVQTEIEITMIMAWHRRWDSDPGHRFMRKLISSQLRSPARSAA
jgi:DNA-binding transcriptional LysR family regulator